MSDRGQLIKRGGAGICALVAGGALAMGSGGLASASTTPTLKASANVALHETIAVDGRGRTVYELNPETTHHLLCKPGACFSAWPPVTVRSAKTKLTAKGVKGKLGILARGKLFQVTLDGRPLYRFAFDHGAGSANGNGVKTFGGTWHVVKEASTATHTTATTTATTTSTMTYTYPPGY